MNVKSLDALNLHDSELIKIEISQTNGYQDRVILYLDYIDNYQTFGSTTKLLVFEQCWKVILDLNFGVAPPISILLGKELEDTELLRETSIVLGKINPDSLEKIKHFYIETISTNSKINIIAEDVLLLDTP